MKDNETVVLAAVGKNVRVLRFASGNMKNNVTVVLAAVGKNGCALQFASENLKDNENTHRFH